MNAPSYILLYVDAPQETAAFYSKLLDQEPVDSSPGFVLFAFENGLKLGFWARETVAPEASSAPGGVEIAITVDDGKAVDAAYAAWRAKDVEMLQPPTDMPFGRTFCVVDPDGCRIRVFAPSGN